MHAVLSPSSASRWLVCTPSAVLESYEPYSESVYADEGTLAHRLSELIIEHKLGRVLTKEYKKRVKEIEQDELYTSEMADYAEGFAVYVLELFNQYKSKTPDAILLTEEKVNLSKWVPDGFGTVDIRMISDVILHIVDLKYGKGVPVFADENKQLMLYALGAYEELSHLYNIETVAMTIYQPRLENISTFTLSVKQLIDWAENELVPKAVKAAAGEGDFVPGDHCRFCRIKPKCKALATYNLELAKQVFKDDINPALLTPEETVDILQKEKFFSDWLEAVSQYALDQAVNHNVQWPGMKLVEGRSVRQYSDEEKVVSTLVKAGLQATDIYNTKIKGITEITKILGKADFERLLSPLIVKPAGKPVLVPETDKRPAFSSADRAKQAFENE